MRLRHRLSADLLILPFAIGASIIIGATISKSPVVAIGVLVICIGTIVALTRPELLLAAGVVFLAVETARIFGAESLAGRPETYKIVLYVCALPFIFTRGLDWRKCAPLIAYLVVTIVSLWFGTPVTGLTASQTVASLATLSLAWLVFGINWDWKHDYKLLKVLVWTPVVSVLLGAGFQGAGILSLFTNTQPPRLAGATIAAWLGTISFCAVLACLVLYRREHWRWARWLGIVDVVILGGTLSRGAVLALTISMMPLMTRFIRRQFLVKGTAGILRLLTIGIIAIPAVFIVASGLEERDELTTTHISGQSGKRDISSGRIRAWTYAYEQAKVNIVFGRGIGSGPIVGRSPGSPAGFTAQHNEYVRMLLEGGIFGCIILLVAIVTTMVGCIRRAPLQIRADLIAIAVAFALYCTTENMLSAAPLAVAFLLLFGIASSSKYDSLATSVP